MFRSFMINRGDHRANNFSRTSRAARRRGTGIGPAPATPPGPGHAEQAEQAGQAAAAAVANHPGPAISPPAPTRHRPPLIRRRFRDIDGYVVHPNETNSINTEYPQFVRGDSALDDIVDVRPPRTRLPPATLAPRPKLAPSSPKPCRVSRVNGAHGIVFDGRPAPKRRAEDTELDLVAANCGVRGQSSPVTRQGGSIDNVSLQAAEQPAENQAPAQQPGSMFGRFAALPESFNMVVTNIRSFLSNVGRLFTEVRDVASNDANSEGNVRNKRIKLSAPGDTEPRWLNHSELSSLVYDFEGLQECFFRIAASIHRHPSRWTINKILRPLMPDMAVRLHDIALLQSGDPSTDLTAMFTQWLRETLLNLGNLYEIKSVIECKRRFPRVPEVFDYNSTAMDIDAYERVKRFLSSPAFVTVCNTLLGLYPLPGQIIEVPIDFIDMAILDVEAYLIKLPLPSYVVSPYYHDRIRSAFPRPKRTDLETHLLLPGAFPEDQEEGEPAQPIEHLPAPAPAATFKSPPRKSTPEPTPLPKITRLEKMRAKLEKQFISQVTAEEYNFSLYEDDDNHRSIQLGYETGRGRHSPLRLRDEEVTTIRSILKNKRKHQSKTTPKRLKAHNAKTVKFDPTIISPTRRSHRGLEIPRLRVLQRQYISVNDKALKKDVEASKKDAPIPVPGSPFSVRESSPDETAHRLARFHEEYDPQNEFQGPSRRILRIKLLEEEIVKKAEDATQKKEAAAIQHARAVASIDELLSLPSVLRISDDQRDDIATQRTLAAERAAEEAKRAEEERTRKELEEKLARTGGLRDPKQCFVSPVDEGWKHRAEGTLRASPTTTLASTAEGVDLRRHDFSKVVPESEWLNDEIVNGSLNWLDRAINAAAGIKDVKKQTRKCLTMSSFFLKRLEEQGVTKTQRTLRRYGVEKKNLLDIDTILVPICERSHWTLLVLRPSKRTVAHMDSLRPQGSRRSLELTNLAMAWMKDVLEEKFVPEEWKTTQHEAPLQINGHDCGVHTITNAMCLALGLHPIDSYRAEDMPAQRIRLACMLLNGGFNGDFDLRMY